MQEDGETLRHCPHMYIDDYNQRLHKWYSRNLIFAGLKFNIL